MVNVTMRENQPRVDAIVIIADNRTPQIERSNYQGFGTISIPDLLVLLTFTHGTLTQYFLDGLGVRQCRFVVSHMSALRGLSKEWPDMMIPVHRYCNVDLYGYAVEPGS